MPSDLIDKENKMSLADGNMRFKFLDRHKTKYVFDEEDNHEVDTRENEKNNSQRV